MRKNCRIIVGLFGGGGGGGGGCGFRTSTETPGVAGTVENKSGWSLDYFVTFFFLDNCANVLSRVGRSYVFIFLDLNEVY